MYSWKNWDLRFDWDSEIGIWGLDFGFGFWQWDLEFKNKRSEIFM